ncbi:MAG: hypothetical protein GY871_04215 [Actinomycetales bacterium]|nr:hypothetical protein [Actinomycetales bacterium]
MAKFIPTEVRDAMVESYLVGETAKASAAHHGLSPTACLNELIRRGIPRRTISETKRKWAVDENWLREIETESDAYWLGMLGGDGYLLPGKRVSLSQGAQDREHLRAFLRAAGSPDDRPIVKDGRTYRADVISKEVANNLKAHGFGLKPARAMILHEAVPKPLLRHYWRGVFDADGYIGWHGKKGHRGNWVMVLTGPRGFTEGLRAFLLENDFELRGRVKDKGRISSEFGVYGTRLPKRVCSLLYEGAVVSLGRKVLLAEKIVRGDSRG